MSLEAKLREILSPPVEGRVMPDVVEEGIDFPCITYQQVGGQAGWHLESEVPGRLHARVQINVWAKTRLEAANLAREAERLIAAGFDVAQPYGAFISTHEDLLKLFGTRQDFGIWYEP